MAITVLLVALVTVAVLAWHVYRSAQHRRRMTTAVAHLCLCVDRLVNPD